MLFLAAPAEGAPNQPEITSLDTSKSLFEESDTTEVTVRFDFAALQPCTVYLSYAGDAQRDIDYTGPDDVTLVTGAATTSFTVAGLANDDDEPRRDIIVTATTSATCAGSSSIILTRMDDDPSQVSVEALASTVEEGGAVILQFTRPVAADPLGLQLSFTGSAVRGNDYSVADFVSFPNHGTTAQITLTASTDSLDEPHEDLFVQINNGTKHEVVDGSATVRIVDSMRRSIDLKVQWGNPSDEENYADGGSAQTLFCAYHSAAAAPYPIVAKVAIDEANSTLSPADYRLFPSTLVIPAGSKSGCGFAKAAADDLAEMSQYAYIDIQPDTNYKVGSSSRVTHSMRDATYSELTISLTEPAVQGQPMTMRLERVAPQIEATVKYFIHGPPGSTYPGAVGSVTFYHWAEIVLPAYMEPFDGYAPPLQIDFGRGYPCQGDCTWPTNFDETQGGSDFDSREPHISVATARPLHTELSKGSLISHQGDAIRVYRPANSWDSAWSQVQEIQTPTPVSHWRAMDASDNTLAYMDNQYIYVHRHDGTQWGAPQTLSFPAPCDRWDGGNRSLAVSDTHIAAACWDQGTYDGTFWVGVGTSITAFRLDGATWTSGGALFAPEIQPYPPSPNCCLRGLYHFWLDGLSLVFTNTGDGSFEVGHPLAEFLHNDGLYAGYTAAHGSYSWNPSSGALEGSMVQLHSGSTGSLELDQDEACALATTTAGIVRADCSLNIANSLGYIHGIGTGPHPEFEGDQTANRLLHSRYGYHLRGDGENLHTLVCPGTSPGSQQCVLEVWRHHATAGWQQSAYRDLRIPTSLTRWAIEHGPVPQWDAEDGIVALWSPGSDSQYGIPGLPAGYIVFDTTPWSLEPPPTPPVPLEPDFTFHGACQTKAVTFAPTHAASGTDIASYAWIWGDGNQTNGTGAPPVTNHAYDRPGTYTVSLHLTGLEGNNETITYVVAIADCPVPVAEFTVGEPLCVGFPVVLYDKSWALTSDARPTAASWAFGDSSVLLVAPWSQEPVRHTYTTAGTYTASLTVENSYGMDNTTSQTFEVDECPPDVVYRGPSHGTYLPLTYLPFEPESARCVTGRPWPEANPVGPTDQLLVLKFHSDADVQASQYNRGGEGTEVDPVVIHIPGCLETFISVKHTTLHIEFRDVVLWQAPRISQPEIAALGAAGACGTVTVKAPFCIGSLWGGRVTLNNFYPGPGVPLVHVASGGNVVLKQSVHEEIPKAGYLGYVGSSGRVELDGVVWHGIDGTTQVKGELVIKNSQLHTAASWCIDEAAYALHDLLLPTEANGNPTSSVTLPDSPIAISPPLTSHLPAPLERSIHTTWQRDVSAPAHAVDRFQDGPMFHGKAAGLEVTMFHIEDQGMFVAIASVFGGAFIVAEGEGGVSGSNIVSVGSTFACSSWGIVSVDGHVSSLRNRFSETSVPFNIRDSEDLLTRGFLVGPLPPDSMQLYDPERFWWVLAEQGNTFLSMCDIVHQSHPALLIADRNLTLSGTNFHDGWPLHASNAGATAGWFGGMDKIVPIPDYVNLVGAQHNPADAAACLGPLSVEPPVAYPYFAPRLPVSRDEVPPLCQVTNVPGTGLTCQPCDHQIVQHYPAGNSNGGGSGCPTRCPVNTVYGALCTPDPRCLVGDLCGDMSMTTSGGSPGPGPGLPVPALPGLPLWTLLDGQCVPMKLPLGLSVQWPINVPMVGSDLKSLHYLVVDTAWLVNQTSNVEGPLNAGFYNYVVDPKAGPLNRLPSNDGPGYGFRFGDGSTSAEYCYQEASNAGACKLTCTVRGGPWGGAGLPAPLHNVSLPWTGNSFTACATLESNGVKDSPKLKARFTRSPAGCGDEGDGTDGSLHQLRLGDGGDMLQADVELVPGPRVTSLDYARQTEANVETLLAGLSRDLDHAIINVTSIDQGNKALLNVLARDVASSTILLTREGAVDSDEGMTVLLDQVPFVEPTPGHPTAPDAEAVLGTDLIELLFEGETTVTGSRVEVFGRITNITDTKTVLFKQTGDAARVDVLSNQTDDRDMDLTARVRISAGTGWNETLHAQARLHHNEEGKLVAVAEWDNRAGTVLFESSKGFVSSIDVAADLDKCGTGRVNVHGLRTLRIYAGRDWKGPDVAVEYEMPDDPRLYVDEERYGLRNTDWLADCPDLGIFTEFSIENVTGKKWGQYGTDIYRADLDDAIFFIDSIQAKAREDWSINGTANLDLDLGAAHLSTEFRLNTTFASATNKSGLQVGFGSPDQQIKACALHGSYLSRLAATGWYSHSDFGDGTFDLQADTFECFDFDGAKREGSLQTAQDVAAYQARPPVTFGGHVTWSNLTIASPPEDFAAVDVELILSDITGPKRLEVAMPSKDAFTVALRSTQANPYQVDAGIRLETHAGRMNVIVNTTLEGDQGGNNTLLVKGSAGLIDFRVTEGWLGNYSADMATETPQGNVEFGLHVDGNLLDWVTYLADADTIQVDAQWPLEEQAYSGLTSGRLRADPTAYANPALSDLNVSLSGLKAPAALTYRGGTLGADVGCDDQTCQQVRLQTVQSENYVLDVNASFFSGVQAFWHREDGIRHLVHFADSEHLLNASAIVIADPIAGGAILDVLYQEGDVSRMLIELASGAMEDLAVEYRLFDGNGVSKGALNGTVEYLQRILAEWGSGTGTRKPFAIEFASPGPQYNYNKTGLPFHVEASGWGNNLDAACDFGSILAPMTFRLDGEMEGESRKSRIGGAVNFDDSPDMVMSCSVEPVVPQLAATWQAAPATTTYGIDFTYSKLDAPHEPKREVPELATCLKQYLTADEEAQDRGEVAFDIATRGGYFATYNLTWGTHCEERLEAHGTNLQAFSLQTGSGPNKSDKLLDMTYEAPTLNPFAGNQAAKSSLGLTSGNCLGLSAEGINLARLLVVGGFEDGDIEIPELNMDLGANLTLLKCYGEPEVYDRRGIELERTKFAILHMEKDNHIWWHPIGNPCSGHSYSAKVYAVPWLYNIHLYNLMNWHVIDYHQHWGEWEEFWLAWEAYPGSWAEFLGTGGRQAEWDNFEAAWTEWAEFEGGGLEPGIPTLVRMARGYGFEDGQRFGLLWSGMTDTANEAIATFNATKWALTGGTGGAVSPTPGSNNEVIGWITAVPSDRTRANPNDNSGNPGDPTCRTQ